MNTRAVRTGLVAVLLALGMGGCSTGEADSNEEMEARVRLDDNASAAEVGLPSYPGSKAYRDDDDSSSGANIRLSTPWFGMKVIAMNLETTDSPTQVASFYRQVLSKYGDVLDCSDAADLKKKSRSSQELTCDRHDSREHDVVYKVGTEENQRIVAIKSHRNGTRFSVVHLDIRGKSHP